MALPLVLVLTSVIAVMVISLASLAATSLRFGRVAENRSDRLTAADAGMRYAIDQLKLRNAGCILDTQKALLPGLKTDFNGAVAAVTCERITSGFEGIQAYAAVMTGEGLPGTTSLLSSQSGSNAKVLGGPVYMSRLTNAFSLTPPVNIKDGPLLYHDSSGTVPCKSVKASTLPTQLVFEPKLIFGPICVTKPWTELFDSPDVPNVATLPERNGAVPLNPAPVPPAAMGSYTDVAGGGGCRVFEPGRYTTPPALDGANAYFKTGEYVFDFPDANSTLLVRQGTVTAGKINPLTTAANEMAPTPQCAAQQLADPGVGYGATFYFVGKSHMNIATQGSLEIHARQQGLADYVSVQTLCTPNATWCNASGDGGLGRASTLAAPTSGTNPAFLFTDSGNGKEFVAHALVYAPLTQVEFGNVSNTATQKMLGGLIVSRLVLQSSTSATNFEIAVPTSPITARIQLTAVAEKDGQTAIQAVVEYRPYESDIEGRVRVNSWRVCETADCVFVAPPPPTTTTAPPATTTTTTVPPLTSGPCNEPLTAWTNDFGDGDWTAEYWNLASFGTDAPVGNPFSGPPVVTKQLSAIDSDLGTGRPDSSVNADYFAARFTKTITVGSECSVDLRAGGDDGVRVTVDGSLVIDDWSTHQYSTFTGTTPTLTTGTHTIVMEYFERMGEASYVMEWMS